MNSPQAFDRCAYLGRVSQPRQKLEHQRDCVQRFCQATGINIPPSLMFEDKERRHKQATDGEAFKRLMALVRARAIDWIIIASFDRWGIKDRDEIFVIRSELRKYDVQLWSVTDSLNITGAEDGDFWRVASGAEAATRYVSQIAEKNIMKMVSMAQGGWACSGNNPFGLDLVLWPLDQSRSLLRVVRMRYKPHLYQILHYGESGKVEREEHSEHMPLRDKRTTGYRLAPSIYPERLKAIELLFEMYDDGLDFGTISENLWEMGYKHYDKPFGYHGVETILSNSAYIGLPAWGKVGVGQYRYCMDKQPAKIKRKSTDTLTLKKEEAQYIYPLKPVFEPVVEVEVFERVKKKLAARGHVNESFGKRRTRSKATHPLNGRLLCPDCSTPEKPEPMVFGSYCPKKGKRTRCFHCGTWRRTNRKKCFANTVPWHKLDALTDELLETVKDRIDMVTREDFASLRKQEWLQRTELGSLIMAIGERRAASGATLVPVLPRGYDGYENEKPDDPADVAGLLETVCKDYDRRFQSENAELAEQMRNVEGALDIIADQLMKEIPSETVRQKFNAEMIRLEKKKAEIAPRLVPLTARARTVLDQLGAIRETIVSADTAQRAALLDTFLEAVFPVFEVLQTKKGRVANMIGARFESRGSASKVLPKAMEIRFSRTDTGSWPRPA